MKTNRKYLCATLATTLLMSSALTPALAADPSSAESATDALQRRVEQMESDLQFLMEELKQTKELAATATQNATEAKAQARAAEISSSSGSSASGTSWHLAGYADASFVISDSDAQRDTFNSGKFNPAFHFMYQDLMLFSSELQIVIDSAGSTEIELEYSRFDLFLNDYVTLVAGKYLSPVGLFQERLHPSWINRLPDSPAGFGHDGLQPDADVGVQVRGGIPIKDTRFTYVLAAGNGPRINATGALNLEGFGGDDNDNKSISGRFGFLPVPYVEIGASFLTSTLKGADGTVPGALALASTSGDFDLWGLDASYTRGPWNARIEYLNGTRGRISTAIPSVATPGQTEVAALPTLDLEAWYTQVAYRLSGVTDNQILGNFEPVLRYGQYTVSGLDSLQDEAAEKRFDVGLNYWVAPSVVLHNSIQWRDFDEAGKDTEQRIQFQFAYGF